MMRRFFLPFILYLVVGCSVLQADIYDLFLGTPTRQALVGVGIGTYVLNSLVAHAYYNRYMALGENDDDSVINDYKVPIIYRPEYALGGPERLHPFDAQKYSKIHSYLMKHLDLAVDRFYAPSMISDSQLLRVHTQEYLDSLLKSSTIALITEIPLVSFVPNILIQKYLLRPMRYATGGTILGAQLALQKGWAINLGGGFHHARSDAGSGFCAYADAPLALKTVVWKNNPKNKVMIVDLDAHQGNGNAIVLKNEILDENGKFKLDARVALFDMYNKDVWPIGDTDFVPATGLGQLFLRIENEGAQLVKYNHPLPNGTADVKYLAILKENLPKALDAFEPQFIIYNAGTDILTGDIGQLNVTVQGIIERDEFVFRQAKLRQIPILMILSGGYTLEIATVIGESIANLKIKKLINW